MDFLDSDSITESYKPFLRNEAEFQYFHFISRYLPKIENVTQFYFLREFLGKIFFTFCLCNVDNLNASRHSQLVIHSSTPSINQTHQSLVKGSTNTQSLKMWKRNLKIECTLSFKYRTPSISTPSRILRPHSERIA